jgi:predicted transcriptional regulator of viral defense system
MLESMDLESKLLLTLEGREQPVFTAGDAKDILKTTDSSVWNILSKLTHNKRIQRIERGKYLLNPATAGMEDEWPEHHWAVVPKLTDNYYVGLWTAMNHWGMTEQVPRTIFIITTGTKKDIEFGYEKYEFVTLSKKKFFGYVKRKYGKIGTFNISSREKTIVDGLMQPRYCGGMPEMAKAMWYGKRDIDWPTVLEMAKRVGINVVLRRLGYILDVLDIEKEITNKLRNTFTGYEFFDINGRENIVDHSKEYGLIINRDKDRLLGWMGY